MSWAFGLTKFNFNKMDIVESSGGFISRSYKEFLSSAGIPLPSAKNEDKIEEYSQFYFSKLM